MKSHVIFPYGNVQAETMYISYLVHFGQTEMTLSTPQGQKMGDIAGGIMKGILYEIDERMDEEMNW